MSLLSSTGNLFLQDSLIYLSLVNGRMLHDAARTEYATARRGGGRMAGLGMILMRYSHLGLQDWL